MAKYEKHLIGDFAQVLNKINGDVINSAMSMNLVDQSDYEEGHTKIAVRVYDKFFMRNGNRASLNLTIVGVGESLFISAIGAGGGQGIVFNFSLGAESDLVQLVETSILNLSHGI